MVSKAKKRDNKLQNGKEKGKHIQKEISVSERKKHDIKIF